MSRRLAQGGRLIDRSRPIRFSFDGAELSGFAGDTLASALLANGRTLVGRSFKYHRPRGVVASGPEEPNALVGIGAEGRFEPNQRATAQELFEGLEAESQNRWPSLELDLLSVNDRLSAFLSAGFYYKTFMRPRAAWKHLFEPLIRRSAGLGRAPRARDADAYEHFHARPDVLVVGGGLAGLAAARQAGAAGAEVLLLEQAAHPGGRVAVDGAEIDGMDAAAWLAGTLRELSAMENVRIRTRTVAAGLYDHGYALACERLTDHLPEDARGGLPRQRLWRIRPRQAILATGAIERPLAFAGNDVPGVMLAGAVRDYLVDWAVAPGERVAVVANNDDGYRTALAALAAGLEVPAVIDPRPEARGPLPETARGAGIRVLEASAVACVVGRRRVEGVRLCHAGGAGEATGTLECDALAMSGGWSPAAHLWSHCGGRLRWDEAGAMFRPDPGNPPPSRDGGEFLRVAGAADGLLCPAAILEQADEAGRLAAAAAGHAGRTAPRPAAAAREEAPPGPVRIMPERADAALRRRMWLDFQNDVKVSDVEQAAREGFESVEHVKRYTTLGMATDQGKLGNVAGLGVLSGALGAGMGEVGTTTFRPPYTPVTLGALAGEARGGTFQPLRRTPVDAWHEANGAHWEPVGLWRRPYCYRRAGESVEEAVHREVRATRGAAGILDASTLGKLLVKGPDAGRFLDMLYTNTMSTLPAGRCRYGLMCSENGFLVDDGVVARLGDDAYLCHTTSGGADAIHAHMEEWLQTEWWDWKVHVANVTERFGQVAVAGPNARAILEELGGMDLSAEALAFMGWAEGTLGGFDVRVFRISFTGELGYEVAVPAEFALAFWDEVVAAGEGHGAQPFGTEALHVMRAEKGYVMIGDETDGTVIPQDLGLDWAISKKKEDYLGKRAQRRAHMADPERWRLVGLETLDGSVLPDGAYATAPGANANGQRNVQGRVTSSYHSPTLGRGIAMGLVRRGPERMGETLEFALPGGRVARARIASPAAYDPDGERQNA